MAREALGGLEELATVREDAQLVASELVSAVVHSGGSLEDVIAVSAHLDGDRLLIRVDGGQLAQGPRSGEDHEPAPENRFRLRVIEAVARSWELDHPADGSVWAELELAR